MPWWDCVIPIPYDETSACMTCRFKEDKLNYWTAVLYSKHSNGSYIRVRSTFKGSLSLCLVTDTPLGTAET